MRNLGIALIIAFLCLVSFYLFILRPEKFTESDLYEDILKKDYIVVGINTNSKPFGFVDKDSQVQGFDADLGRYIAQYLLSDQKKAKFVPVTPANRVIKASTGEVDIVIATMTITPQREEVIAFSVPYNLAGQAIMVNSKSKISSLADLSGSNIGVVWGTTAEKNLSSLLPTANIAGFKSYDEAYKALKNGQINAITSDDTILSRYVLEDKEVRLLPQRYSKEPYGIGFRKGKSTKKLKIKIDSAINDMRQKGILLRLRNKWLIQDK